MEFNKIEDIEKIRKLRKHCRFIDEELDTDVYVLSDEGTEKTIYTLKRIGETISTVRQLDLETVKEAQGKGYASKGFGFMLEAISKRDDISEVYIDAVNPISSRIAEKYGIESTEPGRYVIHNENFNPNYEVACQMIRGGKSLEQVREFCAQNNLSIDPIEKWIAIQKELPEIDAQQDFIPIFEPPTNKNIGEFEGINSMIDGNEKEASAAKTASIGFEIDKNGEIVRPSRLAQLAQQKRDLQVAFQKRQTELSMLQARVKETKEK